MRLLFIFLSACCFLANYSIVSIRIHEMHTRSVDKLVLRGMCPKFGPNQNDCKNTPVRMQCNEAVVITEDNKYRECKKLPNSNGCTIGNECFLGEDVVGPYASVPESSFKSVAAGSKVESLRTYEKFQELMGFPELVEIRKRFERFCNTFKPDDKHSETFFLLVTEYIFSTDDSQAGKVEYQIFEALPWLMNLYFTASPEHKVLLTKQLQKAFLTNPLKTYKLFPPAIVQSKLDIPILLGELLKYLLFRQYLKIEHTSCVMISGEERGWNTLNIL